MSIGGVTLYTYSRLYVHILENAYSPTLLPKGALTPSKWHISPNCWQNISNTNIQIQLTYVYSPNCWQNISNTNIYNTGDQFAAKGPNLLGPIMPGPNLPGSNLPGPNLLPRGPICQTMANWAPKSAGPNLPPNRRGAQFSKNHLIYHQVAWSQKLFCLLSDNLLVKSLHK